MDRVVFTYDSSGEPCGVYVADSERHAHVYAEQWSRYGWAQILPELDPAGWHAGDEDGGFNPT